MIHFMLRYVVLVAKGGRDSLVEVNEIDLNTKPVSFLTHRRKIECMNTEYGKAVPVQSLTFYEVARFAKRNTQNKISLNEQW
jgi:hypothetical protein